MKQLELDLPSAGHAIFDLCRVTCAEIKETANHDVIEIYLPAVLYMELYRYLLHVMKTCGTWPYHKSPTHAGTIQVLGIPIYSHSESEEEKPNNIKSGFFHTQMGVYVKHLCF